MTLVEVMIAAAVLMIVITGLVGSFVALGSLRESAKNLTLAVNDAAKVMEEIHSTTFSNLRNSASVSYCDAHGGTWETKVNVTSPGSYLSIDWDGDGITSDDEHIDIVCCDSSAVAGGQACTEANNANVAPNSNTDLIDVYVTVSWREGRGTGRVIGEDANLNGVLDSGEDGTYAGGTTGRLDSPAQLVSKVTDRGN